MCDLFIIFWIFFNVPIILTEKIFLASLEKIIQFSLLTSCEKSTLANTEDDPQVLDLAGQLNQPLQLQQISHDRPSRVREETKSIFKVKFLKDRFLGLPERIIQWIPSTRWRRRIRDLLGTSSLPRLTWFVSGLDESKVKI